jgi:hypothetical protein
MIGRTRYNAKHQQWHVSKFVALLIVTGSLWITRCDSFLFLDQTTSRGLTGREGEIGLAQKKTLLWDFLNNSRPSLSRSRHNKKGPHNSSAVYIQKKDDRGSSNKSSYNGRGAALAYNDDAFGLIFLTGCLVAQDVVFASVFLFWSALIGGYTTFLLSGAKPPEFISNPAVVKGLPSAPAALSLTATGFLSTPQYTEVQERIFAFLGNAGLDMGGMVTAQSQQLECLMCSVSILWALYQSSQSSKNVS